MNFYYNKTTATLAILDKELRPVIGYSGNIAKRKYQELKNKKTSLKDLKDEMDICKSILLNTPDLEPEIRASYQKRYRELKKSIEIEENKLIKTIKNETEL